MSFPSGIRIVIFLALVAVLPATIPLHAEPAYRSQDSARFALRPRLLALRDNAAAEALVNAARDLLYDPKRPLMIRHDRYDELGRDRTWIDPRAHRLTGARQEVFALAMSDYSQAATASSELPLLASAYVLSGDDKLGARLVAQLREVAKWSPLQREGWTSFDPGAALPPNDGNSWLGTGLGVRAVADTLEILGDDPLLNGVRPALLTLLEKEIAYVTGDWTARRPWFVQSRNTRTNQWMLPTEGLVRACLVVGPRNTPAAYELGVANLFAALDSFGPSGEFDEGVAYAAATVQSALSAARAMAAAGDFRALQHPFIAQHPAWHVQHLQPGRRVINAFDCVGTSVARRDDRDFRDHLALLALSTGSPDALWALRNLFDPAEALSLTTLLADALMLPEDYAGPVPYAAYERATRVNWRSSWADDATGVWVRGGHKLDAHDHTDRGHVNFILRGKPVLIEQGMVHYGDDNYGKFSGPGGHNILQIEGRATTKTPAPITVHRLDAETGSITVTPTAGYRRLERWSRHVRWDANSLDVKDEVKVREDRVDQMVFTWHTGSSEPVTLTGSGTSWTARWPDAIVTFTASKPVTVTQEQSYNSTLMEKKWQTDRPRNASLKVTSVDKVNEIELTTSVQSP